MSDNQVDKLIQEIEAEKAAQAREEEQLNQALQVDGDTAQRIQDERRSKISGFQLSLDLEEEYREHTPEGPSGEHSAEEEAASPDPEDAAGREEEPSPSEDTDLEEEPSSPEEKTPPRKKKKKKATGTAGCIKAVVYTGLVLAISGVLAYFAITGGIDIIALNKPSNVVDVEIPRGASTQTVARVLKEGGLIDQPLIFRLYSKFTGADGTYQPGTFSLRPDMGYSELIETLQSTKPRESVRVIVPEGSTIEDIAKILSDNKVCAAADFYNAVIYGTYDYDFIADLPTAEQGTEYEGRIYKLEGYLFPDTYEFYENSSGETVVKKFLDNFNNRLDTNLRAAIKSYGWSIDKAVVIASIIQGEAKEADMTGVSRVIHNRLNNPAEYPYLQMDSTGHYVNKLYPQVEEIQIINTAYDTYKRKGLPAGPINNPGLKALQAAVFPSEDPDILPCYYFASASNGNTYFSKTYEEHVRICRRYNIGIHAQE